MAIKNHPSWGKLNSDVPPPSWHKGIFNFGGVFLVIMGIATLFGSCSLMEYSGGGSFFLVLMGLGAIIGGVFCFKAPKKEMAAWQEFHDEIEKEAEQERKESELKRKQQHEMWAGGKWKFPEEFESECKKHRIESVESERDYQRAKLIAENILENSGVPKEYHAQYLTRQHLEGQLRRLGAAKLNQQKQELREKEREQAESNRELVDYVGGNKSITYCNWQINKYKERIAECEANYKSVLNGGEIIYNASKGKESSWAIYGGIADGIAGPAAGISVAADIERRNQEIREFNRQLSDNIVGMQSIVLDRICKQMVYAEEQLKYWEKMLSHIRVKLIEKLDEKELLDKLSPEIIKVEQSITGNVLVHVKLFPAENLTIYENVSAVVDGSIRVEIFADNEKVGSALCGLPFGGVTGKEELHIVCTKLSKRKKSYTAKIVPYHLWAVEK